MRPLTLPGLLVAAALSTGCAGVGYTVTASGGVVGPDLVYAAPGVMVIADFDQPIFYADNFYWRQEGVTWYRSTDYRSGWVYAPPPPSIRGIDRPGRFAHYRPHGWTPRHGQPVDHREPYPKANRRPPPPPPPPRDDRGGRRDPRDHRSDGDRDSRDHRGGRDHRDGR